MARRTTVDEKQKTGEETVPANESGGEEPVNKPEGGSGEEPENLKMLVAIYPILYLSHQYQVGDILPANDKEMVEAWIAAGTASWRTVLEEKPKARARTAAPGIPGSAGYSESGHENLVGKVPSAYGRKR